MTILLMINMKRRQLLTMGSLGIGLLPMIHHFMPHNKNTTKSTLKPSPLQPGDQIGLITPGFPTDEEGLNEALEHIKSYDLEPVMGKHVNAPFGYLAGTDADRAADVMSMFTNPEIKGIWCIRGGFGCTRILNLLDYKLIRKNPKLLIGYSDITALHLAIYQKTGLVSFHGPVATSQPNDYSTKGALRFIQTPLDWQSPIVNYAGQEELAATQTAFKAYTLRGGTAQGKLVGGNLSLVSALVGTPYLPSFKNAVVYLEDVGEKPYRIDRMLVQLLQGSDLKEAAGIVLGVFNDCEPGESADPEKTFTMHQVFEQHLLPLGVPICYGMSFGHIDHQFTIPIGVEARLNADQRQIQLLESPVKG